MDKLTLNTDIALLLNGKTFENGNIKYNISTSTVMINDKRVLAEMVVDGFIDDKWEHEISCTYELGDIIESKHDEWFKLI